MRISRQAGIAAGLAISLAVTLGVGLSLILSPHKATDRPLTQPAAIFPETWPGQSLSTTWQPGGTWRLRDSAADGPTALRFEYQLRWRFPRQEFLVVAHCDRGTLDFAWSVGTTTVPCTGAFRTVVKSELPPVDQVSVSEPQTHDWGIAIYSRPV